MILIMVIGILKNAIPCLSSYDSMSDFMDSRPYVRVSVRGALFECETWLGNFEISRHWL